MVLVEVGMKYYASMDKSHSNLTKEWNQFSYFKRLEYGDNFWDWVKTEQKATLDINSRPERWVFNKHEDCMMFILRWT
jgi:hypothetical protein